MANFKFDKTNEELDFTLGGDDLGALPRDGKKPVRQPKPGNPLGQPKPAPRPNPIPTVPQQPTQSPTTIPTQPSMPLPQKPAPLAQQPAPAVAQPMVTPSPQLSPLQQNPVVSQQPVAQPAPQMPTVVPQQQVSTPVYVEQPQYVPAHQSYQQIEQPQQSAPVPSQPILEPQQPLQPLPQPLQTEPGTKKKKRKGSAFGGGRKVLLYTRVGIAIVLIIVTVAGVRSIFFPTRFPTQEQVINVVKEDLGVTAFPTEKANGFVIGFIKTYFTYDPAFRSQRETELEKYISKNILDATNIRVTDTATTNEPDSEPFVQYVIGEPVVVDTTSVDDSNAVFTVQVTLSTGNTLYVEVPVYYNAETNGMAVSAPLSLVPPIATAQVPSDNHNLGWNNDADVVKSFKADLERYLEAWAASDSTSISRYVTTNATLAATSGLQGTVVFNRVDSLEVEAVTEEDTDPDTREAIVSVTWVDGVSENVSYKQTYLLTIKKQPDGRWYVQDITGRITK